MNSFKGPLAQISFGLWFSIAIFVGITGRSWQAFGVYCLIGLFFIGLGLAAEALRSKHKALRTLGLAGCAVALAIFIGGLLAGIERLYLVNADSYPSFLASEKNLASPAELDQLRANECPDEVLTIYEKSNGWVIRCGDFWFDGPTFLSSVDPYQSIRQGESK
ncbi:hypothetical protein [Achromobacter sp. 2789STDY5608633]|uniref:hypothetical protein n=1 Tax=Achromobacter sp. 2789STDY5608633 TaxID=1806501 RepID=UPI0012E238CD|nr:hypothetical protein [Achromobacter sp. 2789STDY5608633]